MEVGYSLEVYHELAWSFPETSLNFILKKTYDGSSSTGPKPVVSIILDCTFLHHSSFNEAKLWKCIQHLMAAYQFDRLIAVWSWVHVQLVTPWLSSSFYNQCDI